MEKDQCSDSYIPFAKTELIKASELSERFSESAGKFCQPDEIRHALKFIFSKIFPVTENFIDGPLFSFLDGKRNYLSLQKWNGILNYLAKKKLIAALHFTPLYCDEPKVIRLTFSPVLDLDEKLTDGRIPSRGYTHGDSLEFEEAISKLIGELLERYPLLIYQEKNLLRASAADLERKGRFHLDLESLAGFSKDQKEHNPRFMFNKNDNFFWLKGKSLFDNRASLIPAQLIFWTYNTTHQNWQEPFLREPNTNGAGGYFTLPGAILSGLYELIQRDGFLIYWLNKKSPPQIELSTIDYEPLVKLLEECRRLNLDVHFYNTTTDLDIPSCICTVFDHTGIGPKISMGGGCEIDWDKMLLRALTETLGVYHWSRMRKERGEEFINLGENYKPFQDRTIKQLERLGLWAREDMFERFKFFLKGKIEPLKELKEKSPKFSDVKEELACLIKKFQSLGEDYEIFYYQAEHESLKDLGYFSVKVIVPSLVSLYLDEVFAPLGAKRLKKIPSKLGFEPAEQWNPLPHPFP